MEIEEIINSHVDFNKYGEIKKLDNLKKRVLFILYFVEKEFQITELSSAQITDILNDKLRIKTKRQAVDMVIRRAGGDISTKRKNGINYHKIMSGGIEEIQKIIKIDKPKKVLDLIIPNQIVSKEKGYFQKVIYQINGCYQERYYDACFVMIRRAVETLIIEVYESLKIENKIKDSNGDFFQFSKLIDEAIANPKIKLSKIAKKDLKAIKKFGDTAAHNRRLNLIKQDIDKYSDSIRLITEELINNK